MKLKVKTINSNAKLPTYGSICSAGIDLSSCEDYVIQANSRQAISTGICLEWTKNNENDNEEPSDYYLRIAPRSGLALKNGIDVLAGVIDCDYRGEIKVILQNNGNENFIITKGDRIAQAILTKISRFTEIILTDILEDTIRGEGGFGSTGIK